MNSKATYFVKLAVPEVNGKPSDEFNSTERHHRYYMLQRLETNSSHFKFLSLFY
jgi:hypothetical protein